eukprot:TRINITY_DN90579_c0_g1_i1.p1 TRINITY_DN90579_c0_g1~~TRINITY_DN90579_c0_g1_i1.p1  ORF type:complete len:153 (-),score=5.70 TRINITY_DN90579_c0_g1_i1:163-621(-)
MSDVAEELRDIWMSLSSPEPEDVPRPRFAAKHELELAHPTKSERPRDPVRRAIRRLLKKEPAKFLQFVRKASVLLHSAPDRRMLIAALGERLGPTTMCWLWRHALTLATALASFDEDFAVLDDGCEICYLHRSLHCGRAFRSRFQTSLVVWF